MPYPNIYALGDCATIQEYDLPATAQGKQTKNHSKTHLFIL
jgi:NADH dehydrogenase FAD-containing subunit